MQGRLYVLLTQRWQNGTGAALHRTEHFFLAQSAEVKRQTDMRCTDDFDDALQDVGARLRSSEDTAAVAHHRVIIQMAEDTLVRRIAGCEIEGFKRETAPAVPVLDHFRALTLVVGADVNRVHSENIFVFHLMLPGAQGRPIHLYTLALLFVGRNPR